MNQGDSRKDQSGFPSRRRPQVFNLDENTRNSNPYISSVHTMPYSNGAGVSHRMPFNYWPPAGYHQSRVHHGASMHRYPGHQVFMQRGPFGGENHQYRPVGYLPQFHLRFSENSEHQQISIFNGDPRRNGYDFHCDRRQDSNKSRFDFGGQGCRERVLKTDSDARSKSGKFPGFKLKVYNKKGNWNNSSNISCPDGDSNKIDNKLKKNKKKNETSQSRGVVQETGSSCIGASSARVSHSQSLDCGLAEPFSAEKCEKNFSEHSKNGHSASVNISDEEGAVGGRDNDFCEGVQESCAQRLIGDRRLVDSCSIDSNLIDEGAICDLDKIFQHQEFSHCGSDNSDDCLSDCDLKMCSGHIGEETGLHQVSDDLMKSCSDDDSESENCSYVYNPQSAHSRQEMAGPEHVCCSRELAMSFTHATNKHQLREDKKCDLHCAARVDNVAGNSEDSSDDGEDTGDFIDTDLPSHNKHILSSSDEMDNISSNSGSDHEGNKIHSHDYTNHDQNNTTKFHCNNLSSAEPRVHNELEALSISDSKDKVNCSEFTLFDESKHIESFKGLSPPIRRVTSCCSSSESENGDNSLLDTQLLPHAAEINTLPYICYNSANSSCLHGGAASSDSPQKPAINSYNSCPPGAECELPQIPSSQVFFHGNMFYHGGRSDSFNSISSSHQSPAGEHNAFTASSAAERNDACPQVHKQEHASCSATSEGGACCPPGYQLSSSVNDLNAFCHHNHSHVANGFNHDRPEANFNSDESNRHQKIFVKFPAEDKVDENGSYSASSCHMEDVDGFSTSGSKQEKSTDNGGSEDPLSHDSGDNVDMVLLPMEEEIEPVHHIGTGLYTGGVEDNDDLFSDLQLATSSGLRGTNVSHLCEDHQYMCVHDQNPLRNGMPSKEFYDLIKTVSTTDSYMRFFDKDGQDVQRQPFSQLDDGSDDGETSKQNANNAGQGSKMERLKVDRVMIWNEYEAYVMQFKQIAVSACGQTAVLNVLKALKFSFEKSAVCKAIQSSLRKDDACIPEYLFSRSKAGTTAEELMLGVEKLSGGTVGSRFFHFWPPRKVKLLQWLAYWMKRGAIPIATLNLQQGPHSLWQVPDSWHHQMVYGVSHQGLYLTNPLEIVSERSAMKQLCSDSVLMVRRQDIISRFRETTDLSQLLNFPDPRWRTMNVLGQVVNVLREFNMPSVPGYRLQVTSHISIPASYKAGITLFMAKDKSAWSTLMNAPEIPIED